MTIKFHRPNIRIPNPLSAAKSAVRAVKHKLQPSGSKHAVSYTHLTLPTIYSV